MRPLKLSPLALLAVVLGLASLTARPAEPAFTVRQESNRLDIAAAGRTLATFVFKDDRTLRPYFANLHTLGGVQVTRNHPPVEGQDATDHDTMHPGVWLAFGDLNGQDFWRNKGRVDHVRFTEPPTAGDERLTFATECRLLAADGATLGSLTNRFTLAALTDAWLLIWEAAFHSDHGDLIFGDQEEMGFGARVATAITEKNGGAIASSSGLKTAKNTWGQPAEWCDYSGTVGSQRLGIVLMADPANFRPSWWHNRDYGLMVANPFGREAMKQGAGSVVTVKRGETFRLRFGAVIHQGGAVNSGALYQGFLEEIAGTRPP